MSSRLRAAGPPAAPAIPTTGLRGTGQSFNADNELTGTGYAYEGDGSPKTYGGNSLVFDPTGNVSERLTSTGIVASTDLTDGFGLRTTTRDSPDREFDYRYWLATRDGAIRAYIDEVSQGSNPLISHSPDASRKTGRQLCFATVSEQDEVLSVRTLKAPFFYDMRVLIVEQWLPMTVSEVSSFIPFLHLPAMKPPFQC